MAETFAAGAQGAFEPRESSRVGIRSWTPAQQAFRILQAGFTAAPIIAGADKVFLHALANWDMYLAPVVEKLSPVSGHALMTAIGVVEMVAGVVVALRPKVGGYLVAVWLWGIILNLLLVPGFYDIALRDLGLSLGALALARLATAESR